MSEPQQRIQRVPPTKSVNRNRAHNIDSDRLHERREHLVGMIENSNDHFGNRNAFAMKALELHAIENVLQDRGEITSRKTERSYTSRNSQETK